MFFCFLVSYDKGGQIGNEYSHTFHALCYARAKEENEETALLLLMALGKACRDLFGIKLDFKGGLVSDASRAFVNALKAFFGDSPRGQCFPHVLLKTHDVRHKRKRGQPGYWVHCNDAQKMKVAASDVRCLHKCGSQAMFDTYSDMAIEGWKKMGATKMAKVFKGSYLNTEYCRFRYNIFGYHGDTPQR